MNTLKNANADEVPRYRVPRCVQQVLPMQTLYADGIMSAKVKGRYSRFTKTFRFSDVNYSLCSSDQQLKIYQQHMELLNTLEPGVPVKYTIHNRVLNKAQVEDDMMLSYEQDGLDGYRREMNSVVMRQASGMSNIVQDKYITISHTFREVSEARTSFLRFGNELKSQLSKVDSEVMELDAEERLRAIHDIFRPDDELYYAFDLQASAKHGHDWKDYICPDSLEIKHDHIRLGDKYARALYLRNYATFLSDDLISNLTTELQRNMMLSIDILTVPGEESMRQVQNKLLAIKASSAKYTQRQVENKTFAEIPIELQEQINESNELYEDLSSRDQKLMFVLVTILHIADTKEELDADTEALQSVCRGRNCQLCKPIFRQLDVLNTVLPFGSRRINDVRTMTTESAASLIPYNMQQLRDKNGICYGQNAINNSVILCNRKRLMNSNGFILGVSGSGKSFIAKNEMEAVILGTDDDVIVIDPEREFGHLFRAMGGEVIQISAGSKNHINAMDINAFYGDSDAVMEKADFILTLCELALGQITREERSIIDRCVTLTYRKYVSDGFKGDPPTLMDFAKELGKQKEKEAKSILLGLEIFTKGNLNVFSHQTNVNMDNRLLCFDIRDLGDQLKTLGMLVMLDAVANRISRNRAQKRNTWLYVDEIYLLFANEYSRQYLFWLWKRVRKSGGLCTGITQNVSDVLRSDDSRALLQNSEFVIMLNQVGADRDELANMYDMSPGQLEHISGSGVGRGLIKFGNALVPFKNDFPKDTELYTLMTTKMEEAL